MNRVIRLSRGVVSRSSSVLRCSSSMLSILPNSKRSFSDIIRNNKTTPQGGDSGQTIPEFLQHVETALGTLSDACERGGLFDMNEGFGFRRDSAREICLVTGVDKNDIWFNIDAYNQLLAVVVPRGGIVQYVYDDDKKEFVSRADGHSMFGYITRELLSIVKGVPQFL